jgi:hypothetical protein
MKTLYAAVAATALLLTARPCLAEDSKIEMTKLTCAQFAQYDKDNAGTIMMWLEGYYTEEDDEVVIDFGKMAGDMAQSIAATTRTRTSSPPPTR